MYDYAKQRRFLTSLTPHWQWHQHKDCFCGVLRWWCQPQVAGLFHLRE